MRSDDSTLTTRGSAARQSAIKVDIAAAAGVGRVTLYGHFPSREALIMALLHHTMAEVEQAMSAVDLSAEPQVALDNLVRSSWQVLSGLTALLGAVEQSLPRDAVRIAHAAPLARVHDVFARGRASGAFRDDQSLAWQRQTAQDRIALLTKEAAYHHNDDELVDALGHAAGSAARAHARVGDTPLDGDTEDADAATARSGVLSAGIQARLDRGDTQGASALFTQVEDQLDPDHAVPLLAHLAGGILSDRLPLLKQSTARAGKVV